MMNADAMIELFTLMLEQQLTSEVFARWVGRHYGDPRLLRSADIEAIVERFDRCLALPPVELCQDDFADERSGLRRAS